VCIWIGIGISVSAETCNNWDVQKRPAKEVST
jgi:hypothetical protein